MSSAKREIERRLCERFGATDGISAVRRAASLLVAEVGIARPPIKLSLIARYLGANIEYNDNLRVGKEEASVRIVNGKIVLWVSQRKFENKSTRNRARFSIAHEIGHLLIAKSAGFSMFDLADADKSAYSYTEMLCDIAASNIIIPRLFLIEAFREREFTSSGIRDLASLFDVSEHALLNSFNDLMPGGLVIELRKYQRTEAEDLTWRVWQSYAGSLASKSEGWLPAGCTLRHLQGLDGVDAIALDRPESRHAISLVRGKMRTPRASIICRWPLPSAGRQLSFAGNGEGEQRGSLSKIDCSAGRLMVFVAKRDRLDLDLFGVGQEECGSTSLAR